MGIVIEEFISKLRYDVDPKKLDDFKNAAKDVVATFAKLSAAIAGAMSGMSAYMLKVNKGIVDIQNMSRALGVSYKFWDALSDNMEIAGFTANDLSKAIGYMSRNLGELKRGGEGAKIFQEAFQDLNLTIKDFEGKSVEDQFLTLTNALRDLGKEDVEKAFSVTKDFLQMRGLAGNRLVRFLTDSDRSLEQMIARTDQIDFMNDEAVDGARKFTQEWNDFTLVLVDSIRQRISGLVGGAVAPMLERFHKWIAVNKELIEIKITEWVDGIVRALKWFFGVVRNGYRIISRIIKFFGGFGNMIKILSMIIVAIPIAKLLMTIAALGSIGKVRKAITAFIAAKAPLMIIVALLIVAALAVDELITYFKGGDTILSKFGEKLGAMLSDLQDDLDGWIAGLFGVDLNTWQQRQARGFLNFQNRAVTAFDTIGKALSKGVKQWKDLVTGFVSKLPEISRGFYIAIITPFLWIKDKVSEAIDFISNGLGKIKNFKIFGKNIGEIVANVRGEDSSVNASPNVTPSSNVVTSNRSNRVNQNNQVTIHQKAGESSQDVANKVTRALELSVSRAVYANDTGVDY